MRAAGDAVRPYQDVWFLNPDSEPAWCASLESRLSWQPVHRELTAHQGPAFAGQPWRPAGQVPASPMGCSPRGRWAAQLGESPAPLRPLHAPDLAACPALPPPCPYEVAASVLPRHPEISWMQSEAPGEHCSRGRPLQERAGGAGGGGGGAEQLQPRLLGTLRALTLPVAPVSRPVCQPCPRLLPVLGGAGTRVSPCEGAGVTQLRDPALGSRRQPRHVRTGSGKRAPRGACREHRDFLAAVACHSGRLSRAP